MAYAVFKTGGKQYRVAQGDVLDVEKLDLEVGGTATFSDLLFYADGENTKLAKDLGSASITAEVVRSEEHTSELQSPDHLVCRLLLEKKKKHIQPPLIIKKKKQKITI